MTERVRVGISSWTDAALIEEGSFYPKKSMTSEARLRYYARFFDTVEVNSSYYAIPDARNARLWSERTPAQFVFNVKAYSLLSGHHPRPESLPAELQASLPDRPRLTHRGEIDRGSFPSEAIDAALRLFRTALQPLEAAGKLGYVLFQFAPWVHFGDAWLEYVATLPSQLPNWTIAIEFRHRSWFPEHTTETLETLREAKLTHVVVDGPDTAASMPRLTTATAPTAVLRLHGRNAEGWLRQVRGEEPTVREKYDYLYSEHELAELVPEVAALAAESERVFVSFNNNNRAYPVVNALVMKRLLGQSVGELPAASGASPPDLFA
jgi:uncharacterized protein YecE (DUF72 family)